MSLHALVNDLLKRFGVPVTFETAGEEKTLSCFLKPRTGAGEGEYLHTVIGFEESRAGQGFACVCPYLPEEKWEGCKAFRGRKAYRVSALSGQVPGDREPLYSTCTLTPEE